MVIDGFRVENIEMKHRGVDIRYRHININPYLCSESLCKQKVHTVEFEDIYEIDKLIHLLKEFKKGCELHIGEWEKEY